MIGISHVDLQFENIRRILLPSQQGAAPNGASDMTANRNENIPVPAVVRNSDGVLLWAMVLAKKGDTYLVSYELDGTMWEAWFDHYSVDIRG